MLEGRQFAGQNGLCQSPGPRPVQAFLCFITKMLLDMFTKNDTVERLFEVHEPYFSTECMGSGPFGPIFENLAMGQKRSILGPKRAKFDHFSAFFGKKGP